MPGRPSKKVFCESMTRASNYSIQCRAKGNLMKSGYYRCKNHAGLSTGPKSIEGKIKALKNLISMKYKTDDEIREILRRNPGTVAARPSIDQNSQRKRYAWTIDNIQMD